MFTLVTDMNITIRGINPHFWREVKIKAVKQGITRGQAINFALHQWLQEKDKKKKKSFLEIEPFDYKGEDAKELSMNVDDVLYGWKR
jgi:hypothetical protein